MSENRKDTSRDDWQQSTTNLQQRLEIAHRKHPFSDVRFRVQMKRPNANNTEVQYFDAHRLVLSLTSPVFAELFHGKTAAASGEADFIVTDVEHKAFECMLTYMYEGEAKVVFETPLLALQTYNAAKKFKVAHLQQLCCNHLRTTQLSHKDVIPIMEYPSHLEINGLRQQCIDVAEDKPLDILRIAGETAKPDTIETFLKMEKLAVSSELFLLKALVEGATVRCQPANPLSPSTLRLEEFIRPFLKHIRFLTMTPQEFALATDLCGAAISTADGYAILLALSHPMHKSFPVPTWCCQTTRSRISQARNVLEIGLLPSQPIFENYDVEEEGRSLISSLEIKVTNGRFIFTAVVIYGRRVVDQLSEAASVGFPSAKCTLNIRNNAAGIAFEQVKNITFEKNDVVLQFPIPLPVAQGQEAKVTVTLDNSVCLSFSRFLSRLQCHGDEFSITLNNYRFQDNSFAISKLYFMA